MRRSLNLWLLGIVLVCAASWWFGRDLLSRPATTPESPAAPTSAPVAQPQAGIQILILNGTEERGLAREYSLMLAQARCVPAGIGNAPDGIWQQSLLVNRRLPKDRARDLAHRLGGLQVIQEWDDRGTEDAVLVLGRDHRRVEAALADKGEAGSGSGGK